MLAQNKFQAKHTYVITANTLNFYHLCYYPCMMIDAQERRRQSPSPDIRTSTFRSTTHHNNSGHRTRSKPTLQLPSNVINHTTTIVDKENTNWMEKARASPHSRRGRRYREPYGRSNSQMSSAPPTPTTAPPRKSDATIIQLRSKRTGHVSNVLVVAC